MHQFWNWKQLMEAGQPALLKQENVWSVHAVPDFKQPLLSVKSGSGCEHQFPHLYSQDGVGVTVYAVEHRAEVAGTLVVVVGTLLVAELTTLVTEQFTELVPLATVLVAVLTALETEDAAT